MPSTSRYFELDLLRSLAVIGMVIYHAAYDLAVFHSFDIPLGTGGWLIFQRAVAIAFLLLVGISFAISETRTDPSKIWRKFLRRGAIVFLCGMLVTLVTYFVDSQTYVRFGVLHLIGLSIILLPFFRKLGNWNLLIALLILLLGKYVHTMHQESGLMIPLGITPARFLTVDYFPLLPWFGVILIGLSIGQTFYVKYLSWRSHLPLLLTTNDSRLTFVGRHALPMYLVHQPIILGILWMVMR